MSGSPRRRMTGLAALGILALIAGCGGASATQEPLASIPIDVDEDLVEPAPLRVEWTVRALVEEEETLVPTRSPALDDRHVYLVYGQRLRALSVADGHLVWELLLDGAVVADPVIVPSGVAVATAGGWLFVDPRGRLLGRVSAGVEADDALAAGGLLIVIGEGRLVGIRPPAPGNPGEAVWSRDWAPAAAAVAAPSSDRVLVAGREAGAAAFAVTDGALLWERPELPSAGVRPAAGERRAYLVGDDTRIRALRLDRGGTAWTSRESGVNVRGAPLVLDGVLWVPGLDGGLHGYDVGGGSHWFRLPLSGRAYLGLVSWGRWVVASPQYGPWTMVRGPLRSAGPTNPGSPRTLTVNSGADLELEPATGPPGVAVVDAEGRIRLLRPPLRAR